MQKTAQWAAVIMANIVANVASLMSGATVLLMGSLAIGAKHQSFPSCLPFKGCSQDRTEPSPQRRGSTGSYNGQGKGGGNRQHQKKKTPKKPPKQNAYTVTMKNSVPSEITTTSGGEREKQGKVSSKTVLSGTGRGKVRTTGFLALQFIVKWLKAPMLRVSPRRGCILTLTQTLDLRS